MNRSVQVVLLFGVGVPLLALSAYLLSPVSTQQRHQKLSAPPVDAGSQPVDDGHPNAAFSSEPAGTVQSVQAAVDSNQKAAAQASDDWQRPVSEQSYWTQLEELERGDKRRALSYALAGEEWYSDVGKPAEARRAKIVTLMVDLGQMSEARERARAFIEQYPRSPYRHLVQGTTGIHPRPGAPPH